MSEQRVQPRTSTPTTAAVFAKASIGREKRVEFALEAPKALAVWLVGTFNKWEAKRTPMKRDARGTWHATVALGAGRHEYRFIVDGRWTSDPKAKESVANSFGSDNSVVVV